MAKTALAHLSNDAVLDLLARSDESALAELYDRYGGPAYRLALRVVRDAALAQDAVQDAFLTAWRTASGFDPRLRLDMAADARAPARGRRRAP